MATIASQQMHIRTETDVISLRQEVRQMARTLGLGLVQQAKIATAISAVARALVASDGYTVFTIQTIDLERHLALDVSCVAQGLDIPSDLTKLEDVLHFNEARTLVDEASLAVRDDSAQLTLRMRLST